MRKSLLQNFHSLYSIFHQTIHEVNSIRGYLLRGAGKYFYQNFRTTVRALLLHGSSKNTLTIVTNLINFIEHCHFSRVLTVATLLVNFNINYMKRASSIKENDPAYILALLVPPLFIILLGLLAKIAMGL